MLACGFWTGSVTQLLNQEWLCCPTSSSVPFTPTNGRLTLLENAAKIALHGRDTLSIRKGASRRPTIDESACKWNPDRRGLRRKSMCYVEDGKRETTSYQNASKILPCSPHGMVSCRALPGPVGPAPEAAAARAPTKKGMLSVISGGF